MKKIELYDIITLANNEEYAVLEIVNKLDKKYLLLSPVNEAEEPNFEIIKIVEEISNDNKTTIKEVTDDKIIIELSDNFINKLEED